MVNGIWPEILAPAGSRESLEAAVKSGANAVYLGGKALNARRGAENFGGDSLAEAVDWCRIRDVSVYLTLNTIVFDSERDELANAVAEACRCAVGGVIVQDMAVADMIAKCAPSLPLHASTQMAVHNLDGVKMLEQFGFSRVVLARELSLREIEYIAERSPLELEVFVHGALCMCVSGQCYLSSMIGGRSGNRGLCAQPCRLPFRSDTHPNALSLKDLSLVEEIGALRDAGVKALKIEGRLKRPEYVAAAVTACKKAMAGERPDMEELRAVFSRGGFTRGYLDGKLGDHMFGVRDKEDVVSAGAVLKKLARLYDREYAGIPLDLGLSMKRGKAAELTVRDDAGHSVTVAGDVPEEAQTAPVTEEKARALLEKTGGTPYYIRTLETALDSGLMIPASGINRLRRAALDKITELRRIGIPHAFEAPEPLPARKRGNHRNPDLRARMATANQLSEALLDKVFMASVPLGELRRIDTAILTKYRDKLAAELPRIYYGERDRLAEHLRLAKELGISRAVAGNLGTLLMAKEEGFSIHGDYSLNIANSHALDVYGKLGLADALLSFELTLEKALAVAGDIPTGVLAYGYLPLMAFRNRPAGMKNNRGHLTDRMGNRFRIEKSGDVWELLNTTPLYLADKLGEFRSFDFLTLYFTTETSRECVEIAESYMAGRPMDSPKTRGLYYRKVL